MMDIVGTDGNDSLRGTFGPETIKGLGGDDTLDGLGGTDSLFGGAGNDRLVDRLGANVIRGETGDDYLVVFSVIEPDNAPSAIIDDFDGGAGVDWIDWSDSGQVGGEFDLLAGTAIGDDVNSTEVMTNFENLKGTAGDDTIRGTEGGNTLFTLDGRNDVEGLGGNDFIVGGSGPDQLDGNAGDDTINGGDGRDFLNGGPGADILDGGPGQDSASYFFSASGVTIDLAAGVGAGGNAEGDRLTSFEDIRGSEFADTLLGGNGNETLRGERGDDIISGGNGDDNLVGDNGRDTLKGGGGDDFLVGGSGQDVLVFMPGDDADKVLIDLSNDVIQLTGFGAAFDTFTEVLNASFQQNDDTIIEFGGGDFITLIGVDRSQLVLDNFDFV